MPETKNLTQEHFESLAKQEERKVLAECEGKFAEYEAAHNRDVGSWEFEARQYGSFLSLFIGRAIPEGPIGRRVFAVNLSDVTHLEVIDGHSPDWRGEMSYRKMTTNRSGVYDGGVRFDWPSWYDVSFVESASAEHMGGYFHSCYGDDRISHKTHNVPRLAKSDRIIFHGAKLTLYAPATKGKWAYDRIMAASAKYLGRKK